MKRIWRACGISIVVLAAGFAAPMLAAAQDYRIADLEIDRTWSRATAPGAATAAGYLTIRNTGSKPDRLISASADFARVELHTMTMENNVMQMRPLADGIVIEAGGEVILEPGGNHVMFMGIDSPFAAGERRKATLVFEKAGSIDVEFMVEGRGKAASGQSSHEGMN